MSDNILMSFALSSLLQKRRGKKIWSLGWMADRSWCILRWDRHAVFLKYGKLYLFRPAECISHYLTLTCFVLYKRYIWSRWFDPTWLVGRQEWMWKWDQQTYKNIKIQKYKNTNAPTKRGRGGEIWSSWSDGGQEWVRIKIGSLLEKIKVLGLFFTFFLREPVPYESQHNNLGRFNIFLFLKKKSMKL